MSKIFLLNGPSGAGKSTTAKAFLQQADGVWAYIPQDDIRDLVKAGYESANGLPETWSDNVKNQVAVSVPLCCDMIRRYYEYGINCIVDFYADPSTYDEWRERLKGLNYYSVLLLPDLTTTLARNNERTGTAHLTDEKIASNHAQFDAAKFSRDVHAIDTSTIGVSEVIARINTIIT